MNKAQAAALNKDIEDALTAIFAKHGLEKGKQNLSYSSLGEVSVTIRAASSQAKAHNVGLFAAALNIKPEDVSREFTYAGKRLVLRDFNNRAKVLPWVAEEPSTGKRYKMTDAQVREAFAA